MRVKPKTCLKLKTASSSQMIGLLTVLTIFYLALGIGSMRHMLVGEISSEVIFVLTVLEINLKMLFFKFSFT